jgi:hypothetical protein
MENESQRIQVDPRNIHYTKRNVPPGPYKEWATPPKKMMSSILGYTLTEDLPGTNTFSQNGKNYESPSPTNFSYIKQYSNQSGLTKTLGHGFHFQHRNSRTFPVESLARDSGRTLVCAEYGYPKGSPNTNS